MKLNKTIEDGYFHILDTKDGTDDCNWEVTIDFNGRNKTIKLAHDGPRDHEGTGILHFLQPGFCLTYLGTDFVYIASEAEFESIPNNFGDVILEIQK